MTIIVGLYLIEHNLFKRQSKPFPLHWIYLFDPDYFFSGFLSYCLFWGSNQISFIRFSSSRFQRNIFPYFRVIPEIIIYILSLSIIFLIISIIFLNTSSVMAAPWNTENISSFHSSPIFTLL